MEKSEVMKINKMVKWMKKHCKDNEVNIIIETMANLAKDCNKRTSYDHGQRVGFMITTNKKLWHLMAKNNNHYSNIYCHMTDDDASAKRVRDLMIGFIKLVVKTVEAKELD